MAELVGSEKSARALSVNGVGMSGMTNDLAAKMAEGEFERRTEG